MGQPGEKDGYAPLQGPPPAAPGGQSGGPGYVALALGPTGGRREWKNEWWQCCGDCGGIGWAVCCATYWCNPCVFGFVVHKAFGSLSKAVKWGALYGVLLVVYLCMYNSLPHPTIDAHNMEISYTARPQHSAERYYIMAAAGLGVIALGVWNRMAMRRRFDIPHRFHVAAGWDDCCFWFWCNGCALCQEARTIIYNTVEDGVWRGPDVMAVEPAVGVAVTTEAGLPHAPPQTEVMAVKPMQGTAIAAERVPLLPYAPPQKAAQASPGPVDAADNA